MSKTNGKGFDTGDGFKVRDLEMAPRGRMRIEWAESRMPVLMKLRDEYAPQQPFKGYKIAGCLHVTKETAVLVEAFAACGAQVAWSGCNPLSTNDEVAAALDLARCRELYRRRHFLDGEIDAGHGSDRTGLRTRRDDHQWRIYVSARSADALNAAARDGDAGDGGFLLDAYAEGAGGRGGRGGFGGGQNTLLVAAGMAGGSPPPRPAPPPTLPLHPPSARRPRGPACRPSPPPLAPTPGRVRSP